MEHCFLVFFHHFCRKPFLIHRDCSPILLLSLMILYSNVRLIRYAFCMFSPEMFVAWRSLMNFDNLKRSVNDPKEEQGPLEQAKRKRGRRTLQANTLHNLHTDCRDLLHLLGSMSRPCVHAINAFYQCPTSLCCC